LSRRIGFAPATTSGREEKRGGVRRRTDKKVCREGAEDQGNPEDEAPGERENLRREPPREKRERRGEERREEKRRARCGDEICCRKTKRRRSEAAVAPARNSARSRSGEIGAESESPGTEQCKSEQVELREV